MNRETAINYDNEYIINTYGRIPLVPDHASGSVMVDKNGKEFVDFTSGIGVNSLGFSNPGWVEAVAAQARKYQHVSNYFFCESASAVAKILVEASGLSKMFFANSGAEANEGAIKLARKYSYDKYGEGRSTIVTLKNSFHGRTVTTLAATGQDKFHTYFYPFTEGFRYAESGDIESLKMVADNDTCAVMLELIQGEGGVNVMSREYVKAVSAFCEENDILLIVDEVQTGCGRTGDAFAFLAYGIKPDIVTVAKGLGGGLPIGGFISGNKCKDTLKAGMHGSTFGANPISTAAAEYVLNTVFAPDFLSNVKSMGEYLRESIKSFSSPAVTEVRGEGLMIGIKVKGTPKNYLLDAFDRGLLLLTAGSDVVRLLPPLNITKEEADRGLALLREVLSEIR